MTLRKLLATALSTLLLLAAAGTAQAAPVFANSATTNASNAIAVTITNGNSPLDGARFIRLSRNSTASPPTATLDFAFTSLETDELALWANARNGTTVSTALVTAVIDGAGLVATRTGATTIMPNAGGAGAYQRVLVPMPASSFSGPMAFDFTDIRTVRVLFTLPQVHTGQTRLLIDAVANPEPGTMALFGIGALGLIVRARRRRLRRTPRSEYDRSLCVSPSSPPA